MALCDPFGFLCYNPKDIISDGFIWPSLNKERGIDIDITSSDKNVIFLVEKDEEGNVIRIVEKRKQLPASGIAMEIFFSKDITTMGGSLVTPGAAFGTPLASMLGNLFLSGIYTGGEGRATTDLSLQLCETETKINMSIKITEEIFNTGIIEFPFYVLSVYAVVKETIEKNEYGEEIKIKGIPFTEQQLNQLGGVKGNPYFRIGGATDSTGQFGGTIEVDVPPPPKYGTKEAEGASIANLFLNIIQDKRAFKFRADNFDSDENDPGTPFPSIETIDALTKRILINVNGLESKDIGKNLYITMNVCKERKIRHLLRHTGIVFVTPSIGGIGLSDFLAIGYKVDAWNYQLANFFVPKKYLYDNSYKIKIEEFPDPDPNKSLIERLKGKFEIDVIEGWRLSESINVRIKNVWAMDNRGIIYIEFLPGDFVNFETKIILPAEDIEDQEWFNQYLENNNLIDKNFSPKRQDLSGALYDISEVNNTFLFDKEKVPYYRNFALAIKELKNKIGIINLDLHNNNVNVDKEKFDLKDAIFIEENMSSFIGTDTSTGTVGYEGSNCNFFKKEIIKKRDPETGEILEEEVQVTIFDSGVYFSPANPTLGLFVPFGSSSESIWKVVSPFFYDKFNTRTRIYIERFDGNAVSSFSMVNARTLPISEGSISLDSDYNKKGFLLFEDSNLSGGMAFHSFESSSYNEIRSKLKYNVTSTHEKPFFNYDFYKYIGYARLMGSDYSDGTSVSDERLYVCNPELSGVKWKDIFNVIDLLDGATNIEIEKLPFEIDIPSHVALGYIEILYKEKDGFQFLSEDDKIISLYFSGTNTSITKVAVISDQQKILIDTRYYRGGPLQLEGEVLKYICIKEMKALTILINVLSDYLIRTEQTAAIFDSKRRLCVFYKNNNNNISVALSPDEGITWFNFDGIIRLSQGETATHPFVVSERLGSKIHLYYVLNGMYLMYRTVNPDNFICEDAFIKYDPPDSFPVDFDDDLGLEKYTIRGKYLRISPSYLIDGNFFDEYFQTQFNISNTRIKNREEKKKTIRFTFVGNQEDMNESFENARYSIFRNNKGNLLLFIIRNDKLYIKKGATFFMWNYIIRDVRFHRNIFPEKGSILESQEIENLEIRNIQTVYNGWSNEVIIFYFHNDMMFLRRFSGDAFVIHSDKEGKIDSNKLINNLDIKKDVIRNRPVFVVGNLSNEILNIHKQNEKLINEGRNRKEVQEETNLAVIIPYSLEDLKTFDDRMGVDSEVQPFAYFTKYGYMRMFYMDSNGFIQGSIINYRIMPTLDVKLINK